MKWRIEQLACSQHDKTQHYRQGEGEKLKGRHDDGKQVHNMVRVVLRYPLTYIYRILVEALTPGVQPGTLSASGVGEWANSLGSGRSQYHTAESPKTAVKDWPLG